MILTILTIAGVALVALSTLPYIRALLKGQVRPRLVSWGVWAVLAGVMTFAALTAGEVQSALLTGVTAAACATVLILGWQQGSRTMARLDWLCLVGALVGIGVFVVMRDPLLALAVSVAVDAIAFIPTLVHAWTDPEEESLLCFALAAIGELLVVAAILSAAPTLAGLLYPIYAVLFNGSVVVLLLAGRRLQSEDTISVADEA